MDNQFQPQQPYQGSQSPLPNATAVLVLGIISIVSCLCYGLPGLICGIISMVLAKKDMVLFNSNPSAYTASSFSNLKAGRTCAIVGLILSTLYLLLIIVFVAIFGMTMFSNPQNIFNQLR